MAYNVSEQKLQKDIINKIESLGGYTVKVITSNKAGTPDILCLLNGSFIGIEVKLPGRMHTLSKLQQYHLRQIEARGGVAVAATSVSDVMSRLKEEGVLYES